MDGLFVRPRFVRAAIDLRWRMQMKCPNIYSKLDESVIGDLVQPSARWLKVDT